MKCAVIASVIAIVVLATMLDVASAAPEERAAAAQNSLFDELQEQPQRRDDVESVRAKRATCDLFSGFGVGNSLCAAHCIARGNRGGYCNGKAVCVCRN